MNNKRALRVEDALVHPGCCGEASRGASTVLISDRPAHRVADAVGGAARGVLFQGSANVLVGDSRGGRPPLAKLEVKVLFESGEPLQNQPFEVIDSEGIVVASGRLDSEGWARAPGLPWGAYVLRLGNRWLIRVGKPLPPGG